VLHDKHGLRFEPVGKKDGYVNIVFNVSQEMDAAVNSTFRGKWINADNIVKSESEMIALWNEQPPEDPILN
jgi:hypothetical protein